MANDLIQIAFDAASLSTIARFSDFQALLESEMSQAMSQVASAVVDTAITNTWMVFANPSGHLASEISFVLNTPMEAVMLVDVPYAWRMEEGFQGTDSLGRTYNEQGKPYAFPALEQNQDLLLMLTGDAVTKAFVRMGGS